MWKLVESEDELAVGMCVEVRRCFQCGKRERIIIRGVTAESLFVVYPRCTGEMSGRYRDAIREGRLYRLLDDVPQVADAEANEQPKRRRKVKVTDE